MKEYLVVDRIEADFAVCEDSERKMHNIELCKLPPEISEGDCVYAENGGYIIDSSETQARRQKNIELFKSLL